MRVTIAAVQFSIRERDPERNLRRAEMFIRRAAERGANIIVFPEDCIQGFAHDKRDVLDIEKKYRAHFQRLALQYRIDIAPGSIVEKEPDGNLYNIAYYIDATGKILARYKKVDLWFPERRFIHAGHATCVFDTKYGKVGLVVCWDLIFPEIFRKMVKRGVQIVLCPSYWSAGDAGRGLAYDRHSEEKLIDALCVARAFENEIILAYANPARPWSWGALGSTLIGHTQITMPFRGAVAKLNHHREGMILTTIDTTVLRDAERVYKIDRELQNKKNPLLTIR